MAHKITDFDNVWFPETDPVVPIGTGLSATGFVGLPGGGVFDGYGVTRLPLKTPYDLVVKVRPVADSLTDLETTLRALRALRGKRAPLRRTLPDGMRHWCWARLLQIDGDRTARERAYQEISLRFAVLSPWYGNHHGTWTIGDGTLIGDGHMITDGDIFTVGAAADQTLSNDGDSDVTHVIITVDAVGTGGMTEFELDCDDCVWKFDAAIAEGDALVIDCGAKSVLNDGTDAYADFDLDATHASEHWLVLAPGDNTVNIAGDGDGTNTVEFVYDEVME